MNTLKLLAFGNSLAPGRDVVGRFRVRHEGLLPRFEDEGPETEVPSMVSNWWRRACRLFRPAAGPAPKATPARQPVLPQADASLGAAMESKLDVSPRPVAGAASTQVSPAGRSAEAARIPDASQREFRFEKVAVVCNDLHDADIEIVPVPTQSRIATAGAKPRALITA